jgi:phage gp36-like protein
MGDYITQAELNIKPSVLIQLTDETNSPKTTIDTTILELSITYAEGKINSCLGKAYNLELQSDSITAVIKDIASDITEYHLWKRSKQKIPPAVLDAYADAKESLNEIKKNQRTLGSADSINARNKEPRSAKSSRS